jgi:hypothetical protein
MFEFIKQILFSSSVFSFNYQKDSLFVFCFLIQKLYTEKCKNNCFHCLNFGNSQQNKNKNNFVFKTEHNFFICSFQVSTSIRFWSTLRRFSVRVPVLSLHRTSMPAISSIAVILFVIAPLRLKSIKRKKKDSQLSKHLL